MMYAIWILVALGILAGDAVHATQRPNIILLTVDTFRADRIGYYGNPRGPSPALDEFAREGVFFREAFNTSGWTSPGLISILTSLYAPTHAVDLRGRSMNPAVETLPEVLKAAGYRVPDIFFLSDIPNFAHLGLDPYPKRASLIHQGDEILFDWLREEAGKSEDPFFLYYHYRDVHQPYDAAPRYSKPYMDEAFDSFVPFWGSLQRFIAREKIDLVAKNVMLTRNVIDFADRDSVWVRALYDAEVRMLDDRVFVPLRALLEETGLRENTIVIVAADHGEGLLDRGVVGHVSTFKEGQLYDEIIRIPMLFWWPSTLPAGLVLDEPVQSIDIMPTLLDLLSLDAPPRAQGQSLLPLIRGQDSWQPKPLFFETSASGYTADAADYQKRYRAMRTRDWKLIHSVTEQQYELYDLNDDPYEEDNVWEEGTVLSDSLGRMLNEWAIYAHQVAYRPDMGGDAAVASAAAAEEAPVIAFPANGDTLQYRGVDHVIRLAWSGVAQANYAIEYEVGEGAYHLAGELIEPTNEPVYGPFQVGFWNSLVMYNPWKFRVYRTDNPQQKSEWVTFYLAAAEGEGEPGWDLSMLWLQLVVLPAELGQLAVGIGRALGDLAVWLATDALPYIAAGVVALVLLRTLFGSLYLRAGPQRVRAWFAALVYVAFVYSTIPYMPKVWSLLRGYTGEAIRHAGIVAVVIFAVAIIVSIIRTRAHYTLPRYVLLAGLAAVYAYLLSAFAQFPAERLHLVEYGFMGYMFLRALRIDLPTGWAYAVAWGITVLVGIGDECIQLVLPQRFFEVKDIQLNAISAGLGLCVVRLVETAKRSAEQDGS